MRRALCLGTLAVLTAVPAAAPAPREQAVLAIDWRRAGDARLVVADPLTLSPQAAPSLALDGHAWPYAFSSRGSRLVVARWQPPSLRIVAAPALRVLRDVPLGGSGRVEVKAVAWLGRQVVVLVERKRSLTLVRVDPAAGRVVGSTSLGYGAAEVATATAWFLVLMAPVGRIGHARLVVATADGVQSLALERIPAGSVAPTARRPRIGIHPGLAVSPSEPRAWVLGSERAAEIDLRTLTVRYRGETRRPSSPQKEPVVGSARSAAWAAPGRLVVAGWDTPRDRPATFEPTGLRLVDTKTWTARVIHPSALLFYLHRGRLLTMAPGESGCASSALTAYTLAGRELYRVCERQATGEIQFARRYARLGLLDGRVAVVDVATGRVVERVRGIRITPLATTLVQEP